ncbi:MAG TPA: hypothetical protein VMS88_05305 [Terriglobales bacterium]|nr:hypothetical protein [Terriglobales bacterium]
MVMDPRLSEWASYYVVVGSSGAALIGLQFVVITLIAALRRRTAADTLGAFGTPTVVLFAGALIVSLVMSAPWQSLAAVSIALVLCGLGGLVYGAVVVLRARKQSGYEPVWEDWLWFAILPCGACAALLVGALFLRASTVSALYVIGAAALALLLIGIHNAWDTITHLVVSGSQDEEQETE